MSYNVAAGGRGRDRGRDRGRGLFYLVSYPPAQLGVGADGLVQSFHCCN